MEDRVIFLVVSLVCFGVLVGRGLSGGRRVTVKQFTGALNQGAVKGDFVMTTTVSAGSPPEIPRSGRWLDGVNLVLGSIQSRRRRLTPQSKPESALNHRSLCAGFLVFFSFLGGRGGCRHGYLGRVDVRQPELLKEDSIAHSRVV